MIRPSENPVSYTHLYVYKRQVLHRSGPGHAGETPADRCRARKTLLLGGICCGTVLCVSDLAQQVGLLYTTVGKSGFLTACYILIVTLINLLFFHRR